MRENDGVDVSNQNTLYAYMEMSQDTLLYN
jgi:hypothetical protein